MMMMEEPVKAMDTDNEMAREPEAKERPERTKEDWQNMDDMRFDRDYPRYIEQEEKFFLLSGLKEPTERDVDQMRSSAQYMYDFALHWCHKYKFSFWKRRGFPVSKRDDMICSVRALKKYVYVTNEEMEEMLDNKKKN